jgi:hypothetical protein
MTRLVSLAEQYYPLSEYTWIDAVPSATDVVIDCLALKFSDICDPRVWRQTYFDLIPLHLRRLLLSFILARAELRRFYGSGEDILYCGCPSAQPPCCERCHFWAKDKASGFCKNCKSSGKRQMCAFCQTMPVDRRSSQLFCFRHLGLKTSFSPSDYTMRHPQFICMNLPESIRLQRQTKVCNEEWLALLDYTATNQSFFDNVRSYQ